MADRPPFLCELDKNKLIDTQVGFVDTFNYAVRAIDNLEGGKNCTVDWTTPDHPIINVELDDDEEGGSSGEAVYDVTEDTRDEKDGLLITYTDNREESFIPWPTLSGGAKLPGPFEMNIDLSSNQATFTNCVMRIARGYFFFNDMTCIVPENDSIIYAITEHSNNPTVSITAGSYATVSQNLSSTWSNMLSTTVTPLYRTISGDVKCDYRYMMNIQAYDSKNYTAGM